MLKFEDPTYVNQETGDQLLIGFDLDMLKRQFHTDKLEEKEEKHAEAEAKQANEAEEKNVNKESSDSASLGESILQNVTLEK